MSFLSKEQKKNQSSMNNRTLVLSKFLDFHSFYFGGASVHVIQNKFIFII